ncbi:RepB family plasmid replication initiator protein [Ochrobactrum intermedium]|uniref:replication initiation protein n=1 Tax=Brucella intermedia TaxID=94625 RepID=UPI00128AFCEF|nr:replication initiation protein [Brucella intermedia]MPR60605.1 RepB family plasmid replication initiator protein [Brucella intermedia]
MSKLIQPATRGSIADAISTRSLSVIAPESPRPLEMLDAVEITSADILTADDAALHELLISAAYEDDKGMSSEFTSLPVSTALKFLGQHARRDALKTSMRRLRATTVSYGTAKTRRFEDVPLVFSYLETTEEADIIRYSLPEPIRILMREMPAYAYLELAPLSQMKSKYSVRLYRVFAAAAAREKWVPGGSNKVVVSAALEDLYRWTGFPLENGTMNFGKFRQRVLKDLTSELSTVRRFSLRIEEIRKQARGRPLERVDFHLNLRAPSHHMTRATFEENEHIKRKIGGADAPEFRVNSNVWVKAQKTFWDIQKRMHRLYFQAWQIALQEALDEAPVSPGYTQRQFRGHRLLKAISTLGPDEAAWQFCAEEVSNPDILEDNPALLSVDPTEAIEARKYRIGARNYAQVQSHSSRSQSQVDESKNVDGAHNTNNMGVTATSNRGFSRPAPATQPANEQVSFIEDAGDVEVDDLDAELLGELISGDDEPTSKSVVVEATAEEPMATEQAVDDGAFEIPADDLGVDATDAEMLADLIDEAKPEAPANKLEGIKEVIWTADRGMQMEEIEKEIWPVFQADFDGPYTVNLTVRVWIDGCVNEFDCGLFTVDQAAIDTITSRLRNHLDDEFDVEYIR